MTNIGSDKCDENNWMLVPAEGIPWPVLEEKSGGKVDVECDGWDIVSPASSVYTVDSNGIEAPRSCRDIDPHHSNEASIPRRICFAGQQGGDGSGSSMIDASATATKYIKEPAQQKANQSSQQRDDHDDEGEFVKPSNQTKQKKHRREARRIARQQKKIINAEKKEKKKRDKETRKRKVLENFYASDEE